MYTQVQGIFGEIPGGNLNRKYFRVHYII